MLDRRVIPVLLLDGPGRLVKTQRFGDPVYVGDPANAVRILNDKEADEILVVDRQATVQGRRPDIAAIEHLATEAFMPVCYGGGVTDVDTAAALFRAGVEKVALNSVLHDNLDLLRQIADRFGSQSVVASVDVRRRGLRKRQSLVSHSGRRAQPGDVVEHCEALFAAGAGELLVTSVDHEGMRAGLDLALVEGIASVMPVPVIAHGGVGALEHIREAFDAGAAAVACGSLFVLYGPHRAVLVSYLTESDRRALGLWTASSWQGGGSSSEPSA